MVPYGWTLGLVIGLVVVVAVVALVTPILVLAYKIGTQARELDAALSRARENTAGLAGLSTTIDHATEIIGGLQRGRARLGVEVLTDGEVTYWTVILVLGAVVIVAVVVLLSLLVAFVKRIDAGVNAIAGTLTAITENTADTKLITATGDGLELVLAEGLQHHLFLGRVVGKV